MCICEEKSYNDRCVYMVDCTCAVRNYVQSILDISNFDISRYHPVGKKVVLIETFPYFYFHFNSFYLKLLISQSKFSGTRKFTLRYL